LEALGLGGAIVRVAAATNSLSEVLGVSEEADGQFKRGNGCQRMDRGGLLARAS
jgi:hypothetical protein